MKKLFITIGVSFVFIVATSVQSSAENLIYGCYKKQNGQLRIVSDPSECKPSEVPISWNQAGEPVPTGVPGKNIYDQAYDLFSQEQYDQTISLLETSGLNDEKSQLLLAKAYLEKSELLKQKGDKSYKVLVRKPYEIGKRILLARDQHLPEALYVCAKSFYINQRATRAIKYVKKAIKLSPAPPVEYFILLGDANFTMAKAQESKDSFENRYRIPAKKAYEKVIAMKIPNNEKGLGYYKLGIFRLYFNTKEDAKQAFESALQFAEKDSLISRIRSNLGSL